MSRNYQSTRPKLACEIAADRVIAARAADSGQVLELCSTSELKPGCVVPDLTENNLRERTSVVKALRESLDGVGGRSRDVIAILPDAAVRVVLLDFETLPDKREEAEGVVRFRLRKSLPFDVDKAMVSYHAQVADSGTRVVAAVALNSVVEDYETAFREAGFSPGIVLPSMLSGEQLAEDVYPSVVFFQDTYTTNIEQIFVAGVSDLATAAPALHAQTGAKVQELVTASQLGLGGGSIPKWRMAGVVGALLSN